MGNAVFRENGSDLHFGTWFVEMLSVGSADRGRHQGGGYVDVDELIQLYISFAHYKLPNTK